MKLEIAAHGETTEVELGDGTVTVGGAATDGIQLPGAEPALLELRIEGERLLLVAREMVLVDGVLSPAGVPRLILAGERIGVCEGVDLRQLPGRAPSDAGTAAVLRNLLSDVAEPEDARCGTLTCLTGLDVGRKFPLIGDVAELGRGDAVHIRIRDRAVSRRHAKIRRGASGYTVEDLQSPNGVFVNGRRARGAVPLEDGAVIELGHSLLRFRSPVAEPEPVPPPPPPEALAEGAASTSPAEVSESSGAAGQGTVGAVETGAAERDEASPGSGPGRVRRSRSEWMWLGVIAVGATLALAGAVATFSAVSGS